MTFPQAAPNHLRRLVAVVILLVAVITALVSRLVDLSVLDRHFLQNQWSQRAIRDVVLPAYRGMITDRNGEPLAISTPVYAAWADPQKININAAQLAQLSGLLNIPAPTIQAALIKFKDKQFIYLERDLPPATATDIKHLNITGISLERQYRRFYPQGESSAPLIGFTNIDDQGQAGLELEYNAWLAGKDGLEKVIQDGYGNEVADLGVIHEPIPGHDLTLTIDNRLQYIAYHELEKGLQNFGADSGAAVILDARTGEILAMVSAPSYNPNIRPTAITGNYRNRAVADVFEPGSTMKTFAMAAAFSTGKYTPDSLVDTTPGFWTVDGQRITDLDDGPDNGIISLTQVLQVSSNVGMSKTILSIPPADFIDMIKSVGFTKPTGIDFPGESDGMINTNYKYSQFVLATISFGYSITMNILQLAHAYAAIANNGLQMPLSIIKPDKVAAGVQVMSPLVAGELRRMLKTVLEQGGTATDATVANYTVAGKTGTTRILGPKGYEDNHHNALFVGMAPAQNPRLVVAIIVDNPTQKAYYGGLVAGPIFAKIMGDSLRILNVPPDNT